MPRPKKNEGEENFISRYMASKEAIRTFPDEKQRLAVAYSEYKDYKKKENRKRGR